MAKKGKEDNNKLMEIETLISTFQKNEQDVASLLEKNNVEGKPLVADQNGESGVIKIPYKDGFFRLIMLSSIGITKNRNALLKCADSEIVTFANDNLVFAPGYLELVEKAFLNNPKAKAIRFKIGSAKKNQSVKTNFKTRKTSIFQYYRINCQGIFFRLDFLTKNSLAFNSQVGPGMRIGSGEDALFLNDFHKAGGRILNSKIYIGDLVNNQKPLSQEDLLKYFYSFGYVTNQIFGKWAAVIGFFRILTLCPKAEKNLSFIKKLHSFNRGRYDGKYN